MLHRLGLTGRDETTSGRVCICTAREASRKLAAGEAEAETQERVAVSRSWIEGGCSTPRKPGAGSAGRTTGVPNVGRV
eukprot:364825-Chlamydomonas_euryale.AAC.1